MQRLNSGNGQQQMTHETRYICLPTKQKIKFDTRLIFELLASLSLNFRVYRGRRIAAAETINSVTAPSDLLILSREDITSPTQIVFQFYRSFGKTNNILLLQIISIFRNTFIQTERRTTSGLMIVGFSSTLLTSALFLLRMLYLLELLARSYTYLLSL